MELNRRAKTVAMKTLPTGLPIDFWNSGSTNESEAYDRIGELWDEFSDDVYGHFEARILATYRSAMLECLQKRGGDLTEISVRLMVDKGTRSRWKRGKQLLGFDNLLTAFAVFRTEFDSSPPFPVGSGVLRSAVCAAMTFIRRDHLHETCDELDSVQLEFVHATIDTVAWLLALNQRSEPKLILAAREINTKVRHQTQRHEGWDHLRIHSNFRDWRIAWMLFYRAISNHVVFK